MLVLDAKVGTSHQIRWLFSCSGGDDEVITANSRWIGCCWGRSRLAARTPAPRRQRGWSVAHPRAKASIEGGASSLLSFAKCTTQSHRSCTGWAVSHTRRQQGKQLPGLAEQNQPHVS